MVKLKNTVPNNLIVAGATIGSLAALGFLLSKKDDKKFYTIGGAMMGVMFTFATVQYFIERDNPKDGF